MSEGLKPFTPFSVRRLAVKWLRQGRVFRGLIAWPQRHWKRTTVGEMVEQFGKLARLDDPFAGYRIVHLKPARPT